MSLTRAEIARRIPHGPAMSLLDQVIRWDVASIVCRSARLAGGDNPLCAAAELPVVLLLEYAAQAAAVHAALIHEGIGEAGPAYVGAVKAVEWDRPHVRPELEVELEAQCLLHSDTGAIYQVEARQDGESLLRARLILNRPAA